ncbi:MAG: dicarboxylate/amino acid:cation symporter [Lysobacterales bacterium]|nr:MAG: dicarboxylate/amino acid:cation symporter [Xanthomonadales bacterium]
MSDIDARLANRILAGLVLGAVAGAIVLALGSRMPGLLAGAQWLSTTLFDPLGQVFLRMLFFVVIPLVFASLANGVLQLGELSHLGPLAGRTFTLFFANMAIAAVLGLAMMNLLQPGNRLDDETSARLVQEYSGQASKHLETNAARPDVTPMTIVDMFMPRNLFGAFVGNQRNVLGDVLPLILFAIFVGAAGLGLPKGRRAGLQHGLETVTELMTGIVRFALRIAPYAVPAMIFSVIVKVGFDILVALGLFVAGCMFVLLLHLFGTMSIWLRFLAGRSPRQFFRDIREVLVTAFSTSSSSATLPAALAVSRDRLGISPSTSGFVLPLGTTMNMSGTALYEGCVVLFIAQVFGVHLDLAQQATLVLLSVMSAVAVAAIPGGSLPLIAGLLVAFGIPPEGIGIILGVDRLLDMTRTMVNVGADLVTTAVVDRAAVAARA